MDVAVKAVKINPELACQNKDSMGPDAQVENVESEDSKCRRDCYRQSPENSDERPPVKYPLPSPPHGPPETTQWAAHLSFFSQPFAEGAAHTDSTGTRVSCRYPPFNPDRGSTVELLDGVQGKLRQKDSPSSLIRLQMGGRPWRIGRHERDNAESGEVADPLSQGLLARDFSVAFARAWLSWYPPSPPYGTHLEPGDVSYGHNMDQVRRQL